MSIPDDWRADALDRAEVMLNTVGGVKDEAPLEEVMDEWDAILQAALTMGSSGVGLRTRLAGVGRRPRRGAGVEG